MWEDLRELATVFVVLFIGTIALLAIVFVPMTWFEGHAKATWLKEVRGIEVPWHEAAFLKIEINDTDANINLNAETEE